jgi:hypothetical protein
MCGGLIHPIASRCKHCRAAIGNHAARQRSGTAVMRALPALTATTISVGVGVPSSIATVALPFANPPSTSAAATASFDFAQTDDRPWWKRWPMIVVAVAAIAIVVAVVMMFWPQPERRGTNIVAPPAPANMDTNPMPETPPALPTTPADPWSGTGPAVPAPMDPSADPSIDPSMPVPGADPGAPIPTPDPDLGVDPDPDPNGPAAPPVNSAARDQFVDQLATAVCRQVAGCTNIDPAMTNVLCDGVVSLLNQTLPSSNCSFNAGKAATCLKRVRTLTCNSQLNVIDAMALLNDVPACLEALHC